MKKGFLLVFLLLSALLSSTALSAIPVTSDSRIKTFVYNPNEVFHITVHYGFMTSIEFANNEDITTIAPGNGYSWKFIKDGRRLFIKALEGAAKTNVTIITSKRTYQLEVESKNPSDGLDEQLVYVVRFFYPEEMLDQPRPKVDTNRFVPPAPDLNPPPAITPMPETSPFMPAPTTSNAAPPMPLNPQTASSRYNFNYTLTGPDTFAPLKIFDDGKSTFMQFPNHNATIPNLFTVTPDGQEVQSSYSIKGDYVVIASVAPQIALRLGQEEVRVFNEQYK